MLSGMSINQKISATNNPQSHIISVKSYQPFNYTKSTPNTVSRINFSKSLTNSSDLKGIPRYAAMGRKVQKHECRCIFDVFLEVYATICLFDFEKTKLLIKLSILEEYATKLGNEHQTKKKG